MRILFMGRKKYAAEMLRWSHEQGIDIVGVVTDSHFYNSPTLAMANSLHIPVISMEEAEESFRKNRNYADLVISYLFWRKIKSPLIDYPKLGCLNFHPAILPDWKGTAGYNIAILNKLNIWGASAHFVDETIDTGDIIDCFKFNFDYRQETAQSLEQKTMLIQCQLYVKIILDVLEGRNLKENVTPNIGGVYISKKEMLELMKVDLDNDDISLKTRAFWFPPYHGAYIEVKGKKYTLVDNFILNTLKNDNQTSQ